MGHNVYSVLTKNNSIQQQLTLHYKISISKILQLTPAYTVSPLLTVPVFLTPTLDPIIGEFFSSSLSSGFSIT